MSLPVSLPMYSLPEMRGANAAFWAALAGLLRADGYTDLPTRLDFDGGPVPIALTPDTLFMQMCGYPLQTRYRGEFQLLATPTYDVPGSGPLTHTAFIVVREKDDAAAPDDLRGRRFAMNGIDSNSGMNLPRRLFAPLARHGRFFRETVRTGSHVRSLELVRDDGADAASIDNVTWAFARAHAPHLTRGLRILAQTAVSPAIPFVTGVATPPLLVEALRRALATIGTEPLYREVRAGLRLVSIGHAPPDAYDVLLRYEREAIDAGYPIIA